MLEDFANGDVGNDRAALGAQAEAAWQAGQRLSMETAVAEALAST